MVQTNSTHLSLVNSMVGKAAHSDPIYFFVKKINLLFLHIGTVVATKEIKYMFTNAYYIV